MYDIKFIDLNHSWMQVQAEPGIIREIAQILTFDVPGARFMPTYKAGAWDGKIRLLNEYTGVVLAGLRDHITEYAKRNGYTVEPKKESKPAPNDIGYTLAKKYKAPFTPYEEQNHAVWEILTNKRATLISPTSSGKSFIAYLTARFLNDHGKKVLIIVPTTNLIKQMVSDFQEYNNDTPLETHEIYSGQEKHGKAPITVSTWQSLAKVSKDFLNQFDAILVDEAHTATAKTLKSIMEKSENVPIRIGLTGTLDESKTHELVLTGLFGPVKILSTTEKLMKEGKISTLNIKALVLDHDSKTKKLAKTADFQTEVDYLISHEKRNKFIVNLAKSLEGNTLVLFRYVERHGDVLYKMMKDSKKPVHYIHGKVGLEKRDGVRGIVEKQDSAILLASYGSFSTGNNIKRIDNVIFAHPYKSKKTILQSIGRGLRISDFSDQAALYDIGDDLSTGAKMNYTLRHFSKRMEIYRKEKFKVKLYKVKI